MWTKELFLREDAHEPIKTRLEINSSGIRVRYLIAVRNNCRGDHGDEKRVNIGAPSLSRSPLGHLLEDCFGGGFNA